MLELRNIHKIYNPGTVNELTFFQDFNLKIDDGDFVSVIGSNGSGKTSMLNIICGTIGIDQGRVIVGNQDISKQKDFMRHRNVGRVFQNPALGTCPEMTIMENLALAENKGKFYGLGRGVDKNKRDYYRSMLEPLGLGLEEKMDVAVGALSGGQRQALSLLMSTMTPIDFLILDEHTAALDPKTAEIIMQLTGEIVAKKKVTTIMVTHNLRYALEYGNRLLMMHEGKVIMDKKGKEKEEMDIKELLQRFDEISLEYGN